MKMFDNVCKGAENGHVNFGREGERDESRNIWQEKSINRERFQ